MTAQSEPMQRDDGKYGEGSEGLRRSTVAHFARKVRGANIMAAKHELKIQQSHAPERWSCSLRVRGPHFASKVSYNAGAATDDCCGDCPFHVRMLIAIRADLQSLSAPL